MTILITGATGFIGTHLIQACIARQYRLLLLTRKPCHTQPQLPGCHWINTLDAIRAPHTIRTVINLAGSPIDRRWTQHRKKELLASRVQFTQKIIQFLSKNRVTPACFIGASAIGMYGPQPANNTVTETTPPNPIGFSHYLCAKWEKTTQTASDVDARICIARFGVVLGKNGGILKKLHWPFYLGLGTQMGNGAQAFSWIHIQDAVAALIHLMETPHCQGVFNLTSPHPSTNKAFTAALAHTMQRPCLLQMPTSVIERIWGQMGKELLLSGQAVYPKRLLESNFHFSYPHLLAALKAEMAGI